MAITRQQLLTSTALCLTAILSANTPALAQFGLGDLLGGSGGNFGNGQLRNAMQQVARMSQPQVMAPMLRNSAMQPSTNYQPTRSSYSQHPICQHPQQPAPAPVVYHNHVSPAPTPTTAPAAAVNPAAAAMSEVQKARSLVAEAKRLFAGGDYSNAQPKLEALVELAAKDANAYQFRSYVHFANEDYDAAAADAYDALLIGNTWDWQTVYDLYKDADIYKTQLRKLEAKTKSDPSMSVHFLLGYQYLVLGHLERGQRELEMVLAIQPEEELVTQLVRVVQNLRNPTPQ